MNTTIDLKTAKTIEAMNQKINHMDNAVTVRTVLRSLTIPLTTSCVHWKCWTTTESWSARRICSTSALSSSSAA